MRNTSECNGQLKGFRTNYKPMAKEKIGIEVNAIYFKK